MHTKSEKIYLNMILNNSKYYVANSLKDIIRSLFKRKKNKKILEKIKKLVKSKNIILTNFGRSALYLILMNLKKETNKNEVLVCSYNYNEVINMIIYANLKPVFYDLNENSLDASIINIKKNISKKTLAVIITHFNGFNKSTKDIKNITKNKKITLIEDCAISLNTQNKITKVSNYGDYSFYSMNFTKNLSSITGGIIKSNKKNIFNIKKKNIFTEKIFLDNFKNYLTLFVLKILLYKYLYFIIYYLTKSEYKPLRFILSPFYKQNIHHRIPGYYLNNLTGINLNLLSTSFKYLKKDNILRIKNNKYYNKLLIKKKTILKLIPENNLNLITLEFPILFKKELYKKEFLRNVKKNKLDIRKNYYVNCSNLSYLKKYKKLNMKNSKLIEKNLVCLPNNPTINKFIIEKFDSLIK